MTPILPARPFQVRTGFVVRSWLSILGLSAMVVTAAPYLVSGSAEAARTLLEERRIWDQGIVAREARGEWKSEKGILFDDYQIELHYVDEDGLTHHQKLKLTAIRRLDTGEPVQVRYLRGRANAFALSAAVDRLSDRWIDWYAATAFAVMIMLGLLVLVGLQLRRSWDVRQAAERSDEVELQIDHIEQVMMGGVHTVTKTKRFRYHCRLGTVRCAAVFNSALGRYPIFTNDEQSRLVALISHHAPKRPVIVRNDLYPFQLDAQQVAILKKRLAI